MNYIVQMRKKITYNNDPQRRCYNGCHFSTASYWGPWEIWQSEIETKERAQEIRAWCKDFFTNGTYQFRIVEEDKA